jgi:hypothetical protein
MDADQSTPLPIYPPAPPLAGSLWFYLCKGVLGGARSSYPTALGIAIFEVDVLN